jgi:hypothetical protein
MVNKALTLKVRGKENKQYSMAKAAVPQREAPRASSIGERGTGHHLEYCGASL